MDVKNKKVLVSGIAKSGIAAAHLLRKFGADVIIQDAKTEDKLDRETLNGLEAEGIEKSDSIEPVPMIDWLKDLKK